MDYLDFLVRVKGAGYGEYQAEVLSSPGGETATATAVPDPMQITALRSKLAASPSDKAVRTLGTLLFETLFAEDVLSLFRVSAALAQNSGRALRLQLQMEPNELSALPWEMLFDPVTNQFLALSEQATLVRYLLPDLPRAPGPLEAGGGPLRILALFPNPSDMPPIDVASELRVMEEALSPLIHSDLVELSVLQHPTVWDMVEALRERPAHILYYQGHVGFNPETRRSYFLLEDRAGEAFLKGMMELSYTLRRTPAVRVVVINSCGMSAGALAYELAWRGVPGAVATQEPLGDRETMTFLMYFSRAVARGLPLDAAVSHGRRAMAEMVGLNGRWASPLLVMSQLDSALFSLAERS